MIFSVLPSTVTALFLSLNLITALSFKDEVKSYYFGGAKEDVFIELSNSNRTLVIKAKKKDIDTNLLIITNRNKYNFRVRVSSEKPHEFIEIEDGQINTNFKKVNESGRFEIFEGVSSLMFVNKTKAAIRVNEIDVLNKDYFSKGVPIFVEGIRTLN